jgi:hypothetical protein
MTSKTNQPVISKLNCEALIDVEGVKELIRLLKNEISGYEDTKKLDSAFTIIIDSLEKIQSILEELDYNIYHKEEETEVISSTS